ncbi:alpha/beta hydrolase [Nocardioides sp. URHA0020]|uniref:alpha/beta hydrolase n=1 Tax=Nocardioides sp. URHA0020 TaxID=1380392 RepID=UPI0004910E1E|nr:alpha/beta hydrolase [Nocardioides sp. URHA0020]
MLFPESRRALELVAGETPVWTDGYDIEAARAQARAAAAAEPREDVAEVRDLDADGVPVRLYRPGGARAGVVVHLHGGGFVFNDVEVHDAAARRLANRAGMAVISVDYRRPPEHRFPAAPDDVSTVLRWIEDNRDVADLRIHGPLYVHGDSAGANLALVAALRHPGRFTAAVLIYPFLDPRAGFETYRTRADGFDPREAAWYWQQYAASPADHDDPDLAPLLSDRLATLPPTLVVTAEHDPLCGEGEHLAGLLADAGVAVTATRYLGQLHGFWRHPAVFPAAEALLRQTAGFLGQYSPQQQD